MDADLDDEALARLILARRRKALIFASNPS